MVGRRLLAILSHPTIAAHPDFADLLASDRSYNSLYHIIVGDPPKEIAIQAASSISS